MYVIVRVPTWIRPSEKSQLVKVVREMDRIVLSTTYYLVESNKKLDHARSVYSQCVGNAVRRRRRRRRRYRRVFAVDIITVASSSLSLLRRHRHVAVASSSSSSRRRRCHRVVVAASWQRWKTDRFLVPFRPGALFSVASYPRPGLSP